MKEKHGKMHIVAYVPNFRLDATCVWNFSFELLEELCQQKKSDEKYSKNKEYGKVVK